MSQTEDQRHMALALEEAKKGDPSPNPHVGAIVVKDGEVIAKGHHPRAGEGHAEANALAAAGRRARGATLYVTLEPCNHHGRTGPCTDALIAAGVGRVVIGCADPHPHVPGATDKLRDAGIEVSVGVLEAEASELVADFAKHVATGLPYVVCKAAVTLDGKVATRTGDSKWITGLEARREAHRMRARADAILVGVGTVRADDPELTVRHVDGRDPLRVVIDTRLDTPPEGALARTIERVGVRIYHGPEAPSERKSRLEEAGFELFEQPLVGGRIDLRGVLSDLGGTNVVRLLVEGGAAIHGSFFDRRLFDWAAIFVAPKIVGDGRAPSFVDGSGVTEMEGAFRLRSPRMRALGADALFEGAVEYEEEA